MSSSTLLLRCAGPMQSWGTTSRFHHRDTGREPSKSGVIGLLCAALGRPREAPLDDLAALRFGVRVDREGVVERDYQTALEVRKADPKAPAATVVSERFYLADAVFLVGIEGDDPELLGTLHRALADPVWPLFLGRKSYVPAPPVWLPDGLRPGIGLEDALAAWPPLAEPGREDGGEVRLVVECAPGEDTEPRNDVPLSFMPARRRFGTRHVRIRAVALPRKGAT